LLPEQELAELNKTLTTMYQAEGTAELISIMNDEKLMQRYDSLMSAVFGQIDSLKSMSDDLQMLANLDSLSFLVKKKHKNAMELLDLMSNIENNTLREITMTSVSAWGDIEELANGLINRVQFTEDTTIVVTEKKGLFKRLKDAIKSPQQEAAMQVNKKTVSQMDEMATPMRTDTLTEFIREINQVTLKKNAEIIRKMVIRQNELYVINELTGLRIKQIMDNIESVYYHRKMEEMNEKSELQRSATIYVALIALAALFVAVFFMTWTLKSLNVAQKLHKDIKDAKKRVEKLLASREQLIYSVTHDIKAPLSSIVGFLELMSDDKPSRKQQYYIENMNFSASHIMDLVRNLLDFQSLEKNLPQLSEVSFSPSSLLVDIYKSFLPLAQKKSINIELNQAVPQDEKYLSDPYRIRQILNNLISNALKFTPENGKVSIVSSIEKENMLRISIKDSGPGIKEIDKTRIFEEFTRLEETKLSAEGVGLGLTISQRLALLLGGDISIESTPGEGADFILFLPVRQAVDVDVELPVCCDENKENVRALFIDDDIVQLNLLSELMKKESLYFRCCSNSLEALKILQTEKFDIILTDIQMPDMKGNELAGKIRELPFSGAESVPIIGFSADSQWNEKNAAGDFSGFLPKPFKVADLLETIRKYTGHEIPFNSKYRDQPGFTFDTLLEFMSNDKEITLKILDSFIDETGKNLNMLKMAFIEKDTDTIKQLSHKLCSLMRMIYADEIVSLLNDFEKGSQSEEKKVSLFRLIEEKIEEAKIARGSLG
jgi:signal transduction histidine kinase/DNA-binding response OmpR family regulator